MNMDFWKPIIAGQVRHGVTVAAGSLITVGALNGSQGGQFTEIASGIIMWAIAAGWSWWQKSGQAKVAGLLKKLTAKHSVEAATQAAEVAPVGAAVK